ncbi:EAL domain-containing protein [Pseudomonas sp. ABC1]|uniref:putative bifunctional diguanylate cyclase/phosphodiesterase n=1 Tax=Pseudomonas sp. ABC1 TaxID=2748080 RepID=UPI0015C2CE5C|nr:EAL domain-containing protein [Pseudomonas sp. ABC1]QLF94061.1 EAL domain-containing protein [Pseudomonas sp. ABC1]
MAPILRALMVEDSEDDALLVQEVLRAGGYDLHALRVDTEDDLLQALHGDAWDIVLADYCLPAFSAEGTLRVLRESGRDIPAIVVSGTVGEDVAVETIKLGADDYLLKQNLTRLVSAVRHTLDVAEGRRQQRRLERMKTIILDSSPDLICMLDAQGFFLEVSAASQAMLGYAPGELEGQHFEAVVHPGDLGRAQDEVDSILGGRPARNFENRLLHRSGAIVHLLWSAAFSSIDGVIVAVGHDISERKQSEQRIRYLAMHDELTGLPNRNLIQDRIAQAIAHSRRNGGVLALLYLDLDRFKIINDGYGHLFGDAVLKASGERLVRLVRECDTVARLGGDEFLILLTDLHQPSDADVVARKVVDTLDRPLLVQGRDIHLSGSVGVSLFPFDGDTAAELIDNADMAMYRSKELGRSTYQFFTHEMSQKTLRRVELETCLRGAAAAGQLQLVYQPKVSLEHGRIIGCEALLRWHHPELGLVSPGHFIPIAEDSGLIVPIGDWVLRAACRQARAWMDAGLPPVCVAVNVSARQFLQQDVVAWVTRILEESGIPPDWLELELTESLIAQDIEKVTVTIDRLKDIGVKLSIDDFGIGYSSLSYLKRFRVDTLKIDQSFVRNMLVEAEDSTIVRAVISLAHNLNFKVIAEGVETEQHCHFLRSNGCDEIQGYYFSKPVTALEFEAMHRDGKQLSA